MAQQIHLLLLLGIILLVGGILFAWFLPLLLSLRSHEEEHSHFFTIGPLRMRVRGIAGLVAVVGVGLLVLVTVLSFTHLFSRIAYSLLMFLTGVALFFWLLHRSQGEVPPEERQHLRWWNPLRRYWPLGMRAQLMIGYTIISSFLLLIFTGLTFVVVNQIFTGIDYSNLEQNANQYATYVSLNQTTNEPVINGTQLPSAKSAPDDLSTLDFSSVVLVRVLDAHGTVIYASPDFTYIKASPITFSEPLDAGLTWKGLVPSQGDQNIGLFSRPLINDQHIYGVIQVGSVLTPVNHTPQTISLAQEVFLPATWLVAILGSFMLASRAFRPIRRLTWAAHNISMNINDLSQRVPLPAARDDVRTMAQTFNEMLDRLDRSFTQQRRFVADASHELRTPVAVIRSMTDVALAQEECSTTQDYAAVLRDVNAEAERLGKLINQLLTLARADDGQMRLDCDSVQLDLLADDVVTSCAALAEERGITLRADRLEPATVAGDTARLIQAIMSLVDNALTYTNPGGQVTLAVATKGRDALLSVTDTGIGIAPQDVPHIFERFYRADPARSRAQGGSGLGLALVAGIVRVHSGSISVASVPGQGSTFTICLPLANMNGKDIATRPNDGSR